MEFSDTRRIKPLFFATHQYTHVVVLMNLQTHEASGIFDFLRHRSSSSLRLGPTSQPMLHLTEKLTPQGVVRLWEGFSTAGG